MELETDTSLVKSDFQQSRHDYSLFTRIPNEKFVCIAIYVDDLLFTSNDLEETQAAKAALYKKFKLKDIG